MISESGPSSRTKAGREVQRQMVSSVAVTVACGGDSCTQLGRRVSYSSLRSCLQRPRSGVCSARAATERGGAEADIVLRSRDGRLGAGGQAVVVVESDGRLGGRGAFHVFESCF